MGRSHNKRARPASAEKEKEVNGVAVTEPLQKRIKKNSVTRETSLKKKSVTETTCDTKETNGVEEDGMASFDFTSPKRLFESVVSTLPFDEFFEKYWEKKPIVLHRNDRLSESYKASLTNLFSRKSLVEISKKHSILFERDVNVFRYKNGKRENLNDKGRMTASKFEKLSKDSKATVQFHQPQRFQDDLWHIMEFLESFFGSLVGANVYLTPSGAQGLPPHYDDVEVFILQLEGEKRWRLYKPTVELPRDYSRDLTQEEIGTPTHDFVLKAGDLLYFPRGTIHQAETPSSVEQSTHITISTYQQHSWGDYIMSVFPHLIEEAMNSDLDFRRGLPINFIKSTKLSSTDKVQSVLGLLLQKLVKIRTQKFLAPESMIEDFMKSRLPPHRVDGKSLQETIPEGSPPDLACKVRLKHPDHVCFIIKKNSVEEPSDDEDEELDEDLNESGCSSASQDHFLSQSLLPVREEECLFLYSSLYNDRLAHMMGMESSDNGPGFALRFPKHYMDALRYLKSTCDQFSPVSQLPVELDVDKENLIRALWSCHLLEVIPSIDNKAVKSTKLD